MTLRDVIYYIIYGCSCFWVLLSLTMSVQHEILVRRWSLQRSFGSFEGWEWYGSTKKNWEWYLCGGPSGKWIYEEVHRKMCLRGFCSHGCRWSNRHGWFRLMQESFGDKCKFVAWSHVWRWDFLISCFSWSIVKVPDKLFGLFWVLISLQEEGRIIKSFLPRLQRSSSCKRLFSNWRFWFYEEFSSLVSCSSI